MTAIEQTSRTRGALTLSECEQFLIHEARLLDEARFDDWLALYVEKSWFMTAFVIDAGEARGFRHARIPAACGIFE